MDNNFLKLFKIPETRQRILRTLGLLIAYRVGFQIPIPGMNPQYLQESAQGLFGLISALSGGALGQTTIFALGIMPYISASIIFSMLTKVSPQLEAAIERNGCDARTLRLKPLLEEPALILKVGPLFDGRLFEVLFHVLQRIVNPDGLIHEVHPCELHLTRLREPARGL